MNWYQAAKAEAETYFEGPRPAEELLPIAQAAIDGFDGLFRDLMRRAKIRDQWEEAKCYLLPHSTECLQRSQKMGIEFKLGISLYGRFIDCPLENPDHIRSMKDDFWQRVSMLGELGTAEFHDYGRPYGWDDSPETKKLLRHSGSLVFSILRDYTILKLKDETGRPLSLGGIRVTVPLETEESVLLQFYQDGLEAMYRINYALHRSAYLRWKSVERKQKSRNGEE